jgi:hypothetical protein
MGSTRTYSAVFPCPLMNPWPSLSKTLQSSGRISQHYHSIYNNTKEHHSYIDKILLAHRHITEMGGGIS